MLEIINLKDEPGALTMLASWHHNEWSCLNPGETLEDRIHRMQPYLNQDFIPSTYVAKEHELLGSAAIVERDMETRPLLTPWLASVFVSPEHRKQGIGSRLVSHVMSQTRKRGISTLYLFTPDRQSFYLKLGWTIKCTEQYHGDEVTIMQINLDNLMPA